MGTVFKSTPFFDFFRYAPNNSAAPRVMMMFTKVTPKNSRWYNRVLNIWGTGFRVQGSGKEKKV
jgi:hypothetical protein